MFTGMMLTGILITIYCFFFQEQLIRVEWDNVAKFSGLLLLAAALRFSIMSLTPQEPSITPGFENVIMVFWEDAFFSLFCIYFIKDYLKLSKKFWLPIAIASGFVFGIGHLYQGLLVASIISFAPFFISYRFGKKFGWGTMMICHILYDFTTLLTVKLFALLQIIRV